MTTFDKNVTKINRKEHSHPAAYVLHHIATGKMYVGSTRNLYVRINKHRTSLENGNHKRKNFQEEYNKHPKLTLAFVRTETEDQARDIEQKILDAFMPQDKLFNVSPDARFGNKGVSLSENRKVELRQKTIAQFSSQEARDKHSELSKQKWQDPEYRKRQAEGMLRCKTKRLVSVRQSNKELWKNSEFRKKIAESRKYPTREVFLDGVVYKSAKIAAEATGMKLSTLQARLWISEKRKKSLITINSNYCYYIERKEND